MKKVKLLVNLYCPFVKGMCIPASDKLYSIDSFKKEDSEGGYLGPVNYEFALKENWIKEVEIS